MDMDFPAKTSFFFLKMCVSGVWWHFNFTSRRQGLLAIAIGRKEWIVMRHNLETSCRVVRMMLCSLLLLLGATTVTSEEKNLVLIKGKGWISVNPGPVAGEPAPPPPYDDRWKSNSSTIIVLIASFRETRCHTTLHNLFTKVHTLQISNLFCLV